MSEHGSRFCVFVPGMFNHPLVGPEKPFCKFIAWQWLIFEASWKGRVYRAGNAIVPLERGQLAHSTRFIAEAWGWPETNVRRFLDRLKTGAGTGAMIGAETGAGVTVITIYNYDRYQLGGAQIGAPDGADNSAGTGAKVAQDRRRKEESKKDRKEDSDRQTVKPDDGFAEWYAAYPKKMQRLDAEKAFRQTMAASLIDRPALLARTAAFASQWSKRSKADIQYCPYPASWLRAGGFDDETLVPKAASPAAPRRRPEDFTPAHWRNVFQVSKQEGRWLDEAWGPPPGSPGCRAPPDILAAHGYGPETEPNPPRLT